MLSQSRPTQSTASLSVSIGSGFIIFSHQSPHFQTVSYLSTVARWPGFCSLKEQDISLLHSDQTSSGAQPASNPMGTGGSFPGDKAVGTWSWPFTPFPHTSSWRGADLIKHSDNDALSLSFRFFHQILPELMILWSRVLFQKLIVIQTVNWFSAFYEIRWFITTLTTPHPLRLAVISLGSSHVGFVVDKVEPGQVSSEFYGFRRKISFHQQRHIH
jgi:hypothetical protein